MVLEHQYLKGVKGVESSVDEGSTVTGRKSRCCIRPCHTHSMEFQSTLPFDKQAWHPPWVPDRSGSRVFTTDLSLSKDPPRGICSGRVVGDHKRALVSRPHDRLKELFVSLGGTANVKCILWKSVTSE